MKIEILIYSYLAIAASMIVFNIVCVFGFRRSTAKLTSNSKDFENKITEQIKKGSVDEEHRNYLMDKLGSTNYLRAFDKTLEALYEDYPEEIKRYFKQLVLCFVEMTRRYSKKNEIEAAYFPYIISKYKLFNGENLKSVNDVLFGLVRSNSVYCRENALHALYSIGNEENVVYALTIIDKNEYYHHSKLITDGLMSFGGDKDKLNELLWESLNKFSITMQVTILDYFRFSGVRFDERMFDLMVSECDSEIHYCAIRYFGRNYYEPAYDVLINIAQKADKINWEYLAITALTLSTYKGDRTIAILKELLKNRNWHVRYNASIALEKLGLSSDDLKDILEGEDKFAKEMLNYRFEQKKIREMEMSAG